MENTALPNEDVEATTSTITDQGRPKKPTLTKILPTDRLAFDRQIEALRAFAAVFESNGGKPVTNQSAGECAKLAASTIMTANAWFVDAGFLNRVEEGFMVAPEVVAFLNAEHGLSPESAPEKLRPVLERHWSSQLLIPRLRVGPLEWDTARKVIGESCGASTDHIGRIDTLLEYLTYGGLIRREGNQIRPGVGARSSEVASTVQNGHIDPHKDEFDEKGLLETYTLTLDPKQGRRVIVKAPPQVSAAELERIQKWLSFQLLVEDKTAQ